MLHSNIIEVFENKQLTFDLNLFVSNNEMLFIFLIDVLLVLDKIHFPVNKKKIVF